MSTTTPTYESVHVKSAEAVVRERRWTSSSQKVMRVRQIDVYNMKRYTGNSKNIITINNRHCYTTARSIHLARYVVFCLVIRTTTTVSFSYFLVYFEFYIGRYTQCCVQYFPNFHCIVCIVLSLGLNFIFNMFYFSVCLKLRFVKSLFVIFFVSSMFLTVFDPHNEPASTRAPRVVTVLSLHHTLTHCCLSFSCVTCHGVSTTERHRAGR